MNLWDALTGEEVESAPAPKGSPILCTCGRRIGVETDDGDNVWSAGYHHTSAGAAYVVSRVLVEDFKLVARLAERGVLWEDAGGVVDTITTFVGRSNPGTSGDLSALAGVLPRLVIPARTFSRSAMDLEHRVERPALMGANAPAGCKKCRRIYDMREVVGEGRRNKHGALLAGAVGPASIEQLVHAVPESGVRSRVQMYRRLNVMLSS